MFEFLKSLRKAWTLMIHRVIQSVRTLKLADFLQYLYHPLRSFLNRPIPATVLKLEIFYLINILDHIRQTIAELIATEDELPTDVGNDKKKLLKLIKEYNVIKLFFIAFLFISFLIFRFMTVFYLLAHKTIPVLLALLSSSILIAFGSTLLIFKAYQWWTLHHLIQKEEDPDTQASLKSLSQNLKKEIVSNSSWLSFAILGIAALWMNPLIILIVMLALVVLYKAHQYFYPLIPQDSGFLKETASVQAPRLHEEQKPLAPHPSMDSDHPLSSMETAHTASQDIPSPQEAPEPSDPQEEALKSLAEEHPPQAHEINSKRLTNAF